MPVLSGARNFAAEADFRGLDARILPRTFCPSRRSGAVRGPESFGGWLAGLVSRTLRSGLHRSPHRGAPPSSQDNKTGRDTVHGRLQISLISRPSACDNSERQPKKHASKCEQQCCGIGLLRDGRLFRRELDRGCGSDFLDDLRSAGSAMVFAPNSIRLGPGKRSWASQVERVRAQFLPPPAASATSLRSHGSAPFSAQHDGDVAQLVAVTGMRLPQKPRRVAVWRIWAGSGVQNHLAAPLRPVEPAHHPRAHVTPAGHSPVFGSVSVWRCYS